MVCTNPIVLSGKEYLQTICESMVDVKTCGSIY